MELHNAKYRYPMNQMKNNNNCYLRKIYTYIYIFIEYSILSLIVSIDVNDVVDTPIPYTLFYGVSSNSKIQDFLII